MSEMVERVAEALRDFQHRGSRNAEDFAVDDTHRAAARAAIAAMHDPDDTILDAHMPVDRALRKDLWQGMIDRALK